MFTCYRLSRRQREWWGAFVCRGAPAVLSLCSPARLHTPHRLYALFHATDGCQLRPPRDRGPRRAAQSVTLKTDLGDIKIEVFCESVPKTAEVERRRRRRRGRRERTEPARTARLKRDVCPRFLGTSHCRTQNFLALCASKYYDGCVFHRYRAAQR